MKNSLRNFLKNIAFSVVILGACSTSYETLPENLPRYLPRSAAVTYGDFTLTISTTQYRFLSNELSPNNLFEFTATVVYNGTEPEILVSHGLPYLVFNLKSKEGDIEFINDEGALLGIAFRQTLRAYTTFRNGEPQIFTSGLIAATLYEHMSGSIPKGEYRAIAHVQLFLDENDRYKVIDFSAEIPFIIE